MDANEPIGDEAGEDEMKLADREYEDKDTGYTKKGKKNLQKDT